MRNIVVVPYNPSWTQMFEEEAAKLAAIFGEQLLAIHHIGSTSIPMQGSADFLNLGVATALMLYEVRRQHSPLPTAH